MRSVTTWRTRSSIDAEVCEHHCRHTMTLSHQAEEYVFSSDVAVVELERFAERELEHLLGPWRERRGLAGGTA